MYSKDNNNFICFSWLNIQQRNVPCRPALCQRAETSACTMQLIHTVHTSGCLSLS